MKKCKYCNKKNIEDDFCSDDCKNKGERYFNYWKKYKYFFGLIIAISIFVIIMQVALYPEYIIVSKILTLVLGLTFFIFPFGCYHLHSVFSLDCLSRESSKVRKSSKNRSGAHRYQW